MSFQDRRMGVGDLLELSVGQIERNPGQPRQRIDKTALLALAGSLEERGVIEPLLVRPLGDGRFELVAGERRWRAAILIGMATVPALVRELDDDLAFELAVIENMARDDLTPIEEARSVAQLCARRGLSKAEIARRVGRSRAAVSNLVRLLELPDQAQELIDQGRLSAGHGRALLLCGDFARQQDLAQRAAAQRWSVRELERAARRQPAERPAGTGAVHPDQAAVAAELEDGFASALGRAARVQPQPAGTYNLIVDLGDTRAARHALRRLNGGGNDDEDDLLAGW